MITQRFNTNIEWRNYWPPNHYMFGMFQMLEYLENYLPHQEHTEMIEIGSYMGESTMMFATSNMFNKIHAIEPFKGEEEFNDLFGYDWETVKKEFLLNTRYWDNRDIITLWEDYSYDIADEFKDGSVDFIYVDGSHEYEDVKRDIELYLPKIKQGGFIAGHDYMDYFEGCKKAVQETVGEPDEIFRDYSWIKRV